MKEYLKGYLKGLGCFYLGVLIISALKWVNCGSNWGMKFFIIPLTVSAIMWTSVFIAHYIVGELLDCFNGLPKFIILIVLGVIGYTSLLLTDYLLPPVLFTINSTKNPITIGFTSALISLAVHPIKFINENAKKN